MDKLDINKLQNEKQILKIGELTQEIIDLLQLDAKPQNIKIAYDRISHCNNHISDFKNEQSYNKSLGAIPLIIKKPDYVGHNKKNNSIEYIKRMDELTLVAVRLKQKGNLFFRSIYPISEVKLKNKILSKEYKKNIKRYCISSISFLMWLSSRTAYPTSFFRPSLAW